MWGTFPLYFPLLEPAGPVEILADRIVWSLVVVCLVLALQRNGRWVRPLLKDRRRVGLIVVAATVIAVNWGVYIYAVNSDQVVEASLGYFINPLVTILFGVVLLGERLRRGQWVAVGIGAVAVVVLTVDYGRIPWIALVLAFSFATYSLVKNRLGMDAVESLAGETAVLFMPALAYLVQLQVRGDSSFTSHGSGHMLMMSTTGVVTAVPLLLFGAAAVRIPLSWIGLVQYVTPTLQFAIGVWVFDESMPASRWVGFILIWVALVVVTVEGLTAGRRAGRPLPVTELE